MKKENRGNDVKVAEGRSQMVIMLERELNLLQDDKKKVDKILDCFYLLAGDITKFDRDSLKRVDQELLWMTGLLKKIFLARSRENQDNLWDLNILLRNVYQHTILLIPYNGYLFPSTKEEILRIILDQWSVQHCDEHGQEIFLFIWHIYSYIRQYNSPEEIKAIDGLIRRRLNDAILSDEVEKWILWIAKEINPNGSRFFTSIPDGLGRLFILARARCSSFNHAVCDIKRMKIMNAEWADAVEIRLVQKKPSGTIIDLPSGIVLGPEYYHSVFEKNTEAIEKLGLFKGERPNFSDYNVTLELVMQDEKGAKMFGKKWEKE